MLGTAYSEAYNAGEGSRPSCNWPLAHPMLSVDQWRGWPVVLSVVIVFPSLHVLTCVRTHTQEEASIAMGAGPDGKERHRLQRGG